MNKVTIKVDGMMCSMCEAHMNETIRKLCPTARKVSSSHKKGEITFLSDDDIDMKAVEQAIEATGYHFISGSSEPYVKRGLFG